MNNRLYDILSCLVVIAVGVLVYAQSLSFDLSYLDDNVWLKDYRWYLKNTTDLGAVFFQPDVLFNGLFYRPMIYLSFILDARWQDDSLMVFRLTNVLLHVLNACLVYGILRSLRYDRRLVTWLAVCFVVHPVLTQAVVWIPGRTDSLLALFVFTAFWAYLLWLQSGRWRLFAGHVIALLAALLTKETAVVLPLLCLFYGMFAVRPVRNLRALVTPAVIWALVLVVYFTLRQQAVGALAHIPSATATGTVWHNLPAILGYLGKIFIPVNLSVLPVLEDMTLWYGWAVLAGLIVLSIRPFKQDRIRLLFGAVWFVLFLIPSFVMSFIKHEYRIYVPLLGMLILILETGVLQRLLNRWAGRQVLVAGLMIIVGLTAVNLTYSQNYRQRIIFWESAVATSPSAPLAHRNLGAMYFLDRRYTEAEEEFISALELSPREQMVHNNLGVIYELRGEIERAEEFYQREIKINPLYDNVYYNLGLMYASQERFGLATAHWKKAIELNPRNLMAYKYLAYYYVKSNQTEAAAIYLKELRRRGVTIPDPIDLLIQ